MMPSNTAGLTSMLSTLSIALSLAYQMPNYSLVAFPGGSDDSLRLGLNFVGTSWNVRGLAR